MAQKGDGKAIAVAGEGKEIGGQLVIRERVIRDSGGAWPMLTRTNYGDWALLMQVMLEARQLWVAVHEGTVERETDRQAMEYLLRSVPPEMLSTLALKTTAKEAWESVKTMRLGVVRVMEAKAMVLKKHYADIKFRDGEDIDDFGMRFSSLVSQLAGLGVKVEEPEVVRKFLSVVPKRFKQMACSITTLLDLNTLSVEELIGRLKASEECDEEEEAGSRTSGNLLLSEEEWFARMRLQSGAGSSTAGSGSSSSQAGRGRGKPRGRGRGGNFPAARAGGNRVTSKDTCRYCGVSGHWARDCRKKKREEAHLVQGGGRAGGDNDEALLMMQACTISSPASTQLTTAACRCAQPAVTEPTISTRPMAGSVTRSVAEPEVMPAPTQLSTRIHWTTQWDLPTQEEPAEAIRPAAESMTRQVAESEQPATLPEAESGGLFLLEEKAQVDLAQEGNAKEGVWFLDSGATSHMTGDRAMFADLDTSVTGSVKFGDGSVVDICGQGTVLFACRSGEHRAITGVFYIPRLNTHIISLGQLDENGCQVLIEEGFLQVRDRQRQLLVKVKRGDNRLYKLAARVTQPVCLAALACADSAWTWHARFGHLNFDSLRRLARGGMVRGLPLVEHVNQLCDACLAGKQRRAGFAQQAKYRARIRLELVHGDLCGPITPATPSRKKFFLLLVDDATRYMWLALLASKDESEAAIIRLQARAEVESSCKLKTIRTDRGGEFNSGSFTAYCADLGIQRHLTAPYSPQQNGVVERRNQTIVGMARSLLKAKSIPGEFWGEAVSTAVFILNRSPTKSLTGMTPYEAWHGRKPDVHFLRTFGCVVHVRDTRPGLKKLESRSRPMIFVGYAAETKGYRAFDPTTGQVTITRDAVFDENARWDWSTPESQVNCFDSDGFVVEHMVLQPLPPHGTGSAGQNPDSPTSPTPDSPATEAGCAPQPGSSLSSPSSPAAGLRKSAAPSGVEFVTPPSRYGSTLDAKDDPERARFRTLQNLEAAGPANQEPEEVEEEEELHFLAAEEPGSFSEAKADASWRRAMQEEMDAIESNSTWRLTTLPPGHRAIGLKWVFKVKKDAQGTILKHKARLVAKGYVQQHGIDYDEVFAPVARLESVRLILAVAAGAGWSVHHMDVKSAFLNGELEEEVFVQQPSGFAAVGREHLVLRLDKALYGLKQAPRAWNTKLDTCLVRLGFTRCESEHGMYARGVASSRLLVGVYVDDLVITGSVSSDIDAFKLEMAGLFQMSDLGLLSYYLGIEVSQGQTGIDIAQPAYAQKLLEKAGMAGCSPCQSPMEPRFKLSKHSTAPAVDAAEYRSLVGSLRYLVHTRPDLAFSVGFVSRFMEAPTEDHRAAVKRILRYIAGSRRLGCRYGRNTGVPRLVGYSDSDLGGDVDSRMSTSGTLFFLGSSPVTWQSQKQKIVALSSCESEYVAAATAACQGIWLARLLAEFSKGEAEYVVLKVDNKSAIALAKNPVFHERSKHIELKYHFIRQAVETKKLELEFVPTEFQLADMLTKPLGRIRLAELRSRVGMVEVPPGTSRRE